MNNYFKNVLFVGPHYHQRGGIASVLEVYSRSIIPFNFISTYNNKNAVYNVFYFIIATFKFIWKLISDRNIKIVHVHSASKGSFLRKSIFILIAKIFRKKTVLHIHSGGFTVFYEKSGIFKFLIRYILNTCDELICLSSEWKTYYDSIRKRETAILNNPVVLPGTVKKTIPGSPIKVLFLNHITRDKGLFDLVECFRLHQAELAGNFKLIIAGEGQTGELKRILSTSELNGTVEHKGWVTGKLKDELIQDCDVFILTSYYEGLPMSILESMSFGKPVISTNVGGIPRIVKQGENGWLTSPGDIEALLTVFNEIKANPAILSSYGDRSLQIVQDYVPQKVNEALNEIYAGLLSNNKKTIRTMIGKLRLQLIDLIRGTAVLPKLEELKIHQYLPEAQLEAIRKSRQEKIFNIAQKYTTYYAKYNSFEEVPVTTKEIIRENTSGLFSSTYKKKLFKKKSGGSTGVPLVYYTTSESQSYLWASIILSWEMAGYQLGDKVGFLAGTSLIKEGLPNRIFYALFNIKMYPATPLNPRVLKAHAEGIKREKVKIIYGYAHVINELADYVKTMGPGYLPDLKGIVCTAEILTDDMRANISQAFGAKVVNQYGCGEGGASAFECSEGKMHLISSKIEYEVHADGFLVSTDLSNEGFLMLKYDTGDMLEFSDKPCSCGRTFPVIDRVIGRTADLVTDRENNKLHDSFFYFLFKLEPTVKQYQVVYNEDVIAITVKTQSPKKAEEYNKYLEEVKAQVKFREYRMLLDEPFILLKNGKHKQIIDNRKR